MIINNKNILKFCLITGLMLFIFTLGVNALGIGSPYSVDSPLKMYAGETKIVMLSLQNSDTEGKVTLKGTITEGNDIASLDKENYAVYYKEETLAKMEIKIPEASKVGDKYTIKYEFLQTSSENENGMVQMGRKIDRSFDVVVSEKSDQEVPNQSSQKSNLIIWIIASVLVIIIIIVAVLLFFKKN
jgi:hypothetical protein